MADAVVLERPRLGRLHLRVRGPLDAAVGALLLTAVRDGLVGGAAEVVLDLRGVVDHDLAGQTALQSAQALIAAAGARSAHIVARPRIRGLVLRVCHGLQDPGARPVACEAMADAWLAGADPRPFADVSFAQAEQLLARVREGQA